MIFVLSLGTNIPCRLDRIKKAREAIGVLHDVSITASSALYETEPVDVMPEHSDKFFLNAALLVESDLSPLDFSEAMHSIEKEQGRIRDPNDSNAPRAIDIDLVGAGACIINTPLLTLPHPRWHERGFVVIPMNDICPELTLPNQARRVSEIMKDLPRTPVVTKYRTNW